MWTNRVFMRGLISGIQKSAALIPDTKPPVVLKSINELDPNNDDIWQAKLDGAFVYYTLGPRGIRAFSYRRSKKTGDVIEHTEKLQGLQNAKVPKELYGAVLQGEAWHPELAAREVGGILNSRKIEYKDELQAALHGIEKIPGVDLSQLNNHEKLELLRDIATKISVFDLPETAYSHSEKKTLLKKIESGNHPQTEEGIIGYPKEGKLYKIVFSPTHDLPVVGITEGEGGIEGKGIGALLVGTQENPTRVGTGLSSKMREVFYKNPELIKGLIARVKAKEVFPSGKLRAPSLQDFHPVKSDPDSLSKLEDLLAKTSFYKEAKIKKEKNKFFLYTNNGQVLGKHDTYEQALAQHKAVAISKLRKAKLAFDVEFAPGIPRHRKIRKIPTLKNKKWEFVVQEHDAFRAGKHWDLRLGDPKTEFAHSWAVPRAKFPDIKNPKLLAIPQSTHTLDYMDFEGDIPYGSYGAGKVKQIKRETVDIFSTSPDKIVFDIPGEGEMILRKTKKDDWI